MLNKFGCLALIGPLLGGCSLTTPRAPDLSTPAAFEAPRRDAGLPVSSLEQWWRLYQDPQLEALVAEALQGGFDTRLARARLEEARTQRAEAGYEIYWPKGGIEASATQASGGGEADDGDGYSAGFSPTWELDLFGRRAASARVAAADLNSAEFTAEATRWVLIAQVADNLFAARGLAVQLAETRETLRIQLALDASAKARVDRGLVPASDAAQTQANVAAARAQIQGLEAQLDAARRALLALVGRGRGPAAGLVILPQLGLAPSAPQTVPGDLLIRRPDVREAQARLASAAGRQQLAHLDFFPTFTLSPSYGLTKLTGSDASGIWSLGANAKIPVLDVPRLRMALRAQQAVSEQQVLTYERAVQTAYVEAETALRYLESDSRRVTWLGAAERDAAIGYQAKSEGYRRGFNDLQAALAAESSWRQTRLTLASAQVTTLQRSVQVFKALGGGWTPPPAREVAVSAPTHSPLLGQGAR